MHLLRRFLGKHLVMFMLIVLLCLIFCCKVIFCLFFFFLTLFWVDAVGGLVIINLSFLQVFSKWNLWGVKIDLNFVWHHVAILFLSGLNNGVEGQINFLIYVLRVFIQFCVGVFSWGNSSFFFSLGKVIHSAVNSQINLL